MAKFLLSTFIISALVISTVNAVVGGDVSSLVTKEQFECAKTHHGWEFVIIRSYCSLNATDPHVVQTLANAKAAGIKYRDIYHFPCAMHDAYAQVKADLDHVGRGNFGQMWFDIEHNPSPGCEWSRDKAANCRFVGDLISAAESLNITAAVYASKGGWAENVGTNCTVASHLPLWYPLWDGARNFNGWEPYGGWTKPTIHQFNNHFARGCGIDADADYYV